MTLFIILLVSLITTDAAVNLFHDSIDELKQSTRDKINLLRFILTLIVFLFSLLTLDENQQLKEDNPCSEYEQIVSPIYRKVK